MSSETKHIISRIGETDQLYLSENTATLALERADLRLQLVVISQIKAEQIHFLQEAIVLLEQARIEHDELPLSLYLDLSLLLAKSYMLYFEISHEQRFALITQQILKPLAHYAHGEIYFMLAYASISKHEHALTQYWLKKYFATADADLRLLHSHHAFKPVHEIQWFKDMIKRKVH